MPRLRWFIVVSVVCGAAIAAGASTSRWREAVVVSASTMRGAQRLRWLLAALHMPGFARLEPDDAPTWTTSLLAESVGWLLLMSLASASGAVRLSAADVWAA